ncbi:MAG: hypothetical protein QXI16_04550 [Sulfolobaceae archaeon]
MYVRDFFQILMFHDINDPNTIRRLNELGELLSIDSILVSELGTIPSPLRIKMLRYFLDNKDYLSSFPYYFQEEEILNFLATN